MRFGETDAHVVAIIPCLDEENAIGDVVRDVRAEGVDRVIVVDGNSRDRTAFYAREAGADVVVEPRRGYGRACAAGVAEAEAEDADVLVFLDGDGSDDVAHLRAIVGPVVRNEADFVMGSRLRGPREPGSMTPQQAAAGFVAGVLLRVRYRARFTDMSPFRAIRPAVLGTLDMRETTFGWNLEMQMRAAAKHLRIIEIAIGCRRRRGGQSKVSGNAAAVLPAAWSIAKTFLRIVADMKRP